MMLEITVTTNNGEKIVVFIENYSAVELAEQLNDSSKNMIALGDNVVQRFAVTSIIPVKKETTTS